MAEFKGFECDGTCAEVDPDNNGIYPNSERNDVIVRFVGPTVSGETTKNYCPVCIKDAARKAGTLTPLKKRHRASVPSPSVAPNPTSPTGVVASGGGA